MAVIFHSACSTSNGGRGTPSNRGPLEEGISRKHKTILVADDDSIVRSLMGAVLTKAGFGSRIVTNGKDAFDTYREGGIDLVISDREMPGMDGLELLKALREHDADAKVIILSGGINEEQRAQFIEEGAIMVMKKPCRNQEIVDAIEANI